MSSTGRNLEAHPVHPLGAYDTPPDLYAAIVAELRERRELYHQDRILEPSVGGGSLVLALEAAGHDLAALEVMDVDPFAPGLDLAYARGSRVTTPSSETRDQVAAERWARELEALGIPRYRQALAVSGFLVTPPASRPLWVFGNPPYSVIDPACPCPDCDGSGQVPGARGGSRKCPACNRWPAGKRPQGLPEGHQAERLIAVADLHVRRALEVTRRHVVYVLRLPYLGGMDRFSSLWAGGGLRAVWTAVGRPSYAHGGTDSVETAVFWWDRNWTKPHFEGGWLTWKGGAP